MKILFAASEAAPYIKTGGLGDVAAALPKALTADADAEVYVFLPCYQSILNDPSFELEEIFQFNTPLSWRNIRTTLYRAVCPEDQPRFYFIDSPYHFHRDQIYGCGDDPERFAFFSKAILECLQHLNWYPDVIHANDWQTALIPVFLRAFYQGLEAYRPIRTLFTIHNMEYQGKTGSGFTDDVLGLPEDWKGTMDFDGCVNLMKAAILVADRVSTVSRTYAQEIRDPFYGHGLHNVLGYHGYKLCGVVNGIDTEEFDPETDPLIHRTFGADDPEGKAENKRFLQQRLGLPQKDDIPLVIMVSRLVGHKGLDLVQAVINDLMEEDLQLAVIGTGDDQYQEMFIRYASAYPQKVSAVIAFDNTLAHQAYAGGDLVLMPSRQEPCGLTQLIAMRYGTVPIVRETGGLRDTVPALNPETMDGLGFTFRTYNAHDMLDAIRRALDFYRGQNGWDTLRRNAMLHDSSWKHSVQDYWQIYRSMV